MLRLPTLSSVSTDPPANRNGLLKLRARAATHNKTRRRPVVATRGKLKYYRRVLTVFYPFDLRDVAPFSVLSQRPHGFTSEEKFTSKTPHGAAFPTNFSREPTRIFPRWPAAYSEPPQFRRHI
ncbi:hypothetical protein EVAR_81_1 [Eumeta japonica]|uniref:Uncharacterized protein n=1 Tax=Eumeta variegata TaxID=151549 RepID=A0A4C1SB81_EUMVA|nr:hypothetical protein EVAR_81_1 [Eumeta japonica]